MSDPLILAAYPVSRDYSRLAQLARQSSIICIVNFRTSASEPPLRDVASTSYQQHRGRDMFQISARGTGYVTAFGEEDFIPRLTYSLRGNEASKNPKPDSVGGSGFLLPSAYHTHATGRDAWSILTA